MRGMNADKSKPIIAITGSTGLIGTRICERLADRYAIVGLDIKEPDQPLDGVDWVECDFTSDKSVVAALDTIRNKYGETLASVIHLAAYYDFAGEPSPLYNDLTVEGTRRLLHGLRRFDRVEQFIFSSSVLVMEPCDPGEMLHESSSTQAEWEYPQSKLDAERVIQNQHGTIPALILRLAGAYDEDCHSIPVAQNIRRIAEKEFESYFFPGDAERGQTFVHLDDIVQCFACAIERRHELKNYELLLIGEDECLSYERLQDLIGELLHGVDDWPTIRIPKPLAKAGAWVKEKIAASEEDEPFIKPWMVDLADCHYPVDNSRARAVLGWQPRHRLSATLPEMIRRLKQDPEGWYNANKLPVPDDKEVLAEMAASH
jgi:nucleoside-diphosphate-sugar epimerase